MFIAIDANIFIKYLNPKLDNQGFDSIIENLAAYDIPYYIPTPVLSEILIYLNESQAKKMLSEIISSDVFKILPFDTKSAVELAHMDRDVIVKNDKREGSQEPYQKIKLDRQIIAICKANGIQAFYSEDKNLCRIAKRHGLTIHGLLIKDYTP